MPRAPVHRRPAEKRRAVREAPPAPAPAATAPERLQKMLARAGLASRGDADGWCRAGRLTNTGVVATLGGRVGAHDQVRLDGRLVRSRAGVDEARAFLCHRSPGEPLAAPGATGGDPHSAALRPALLQRLPRRAGRRFITVSPMPRVDGGLELVTADGELAARLQRGVRQLMSEFGVRVRGELNETQLAGVLAGTLDSGARLPVERCTAAGGEGSNRWYTLAARGASGKEVRQLFERQGALVSRVMRTHLGPVTLERALGRGQFRELTPGELTALLPAGAAAASG
ncbi:MAG: 23S rRNA pseudouridine(2605) synthase RluB [Steroidobacteraceae bacterium]